MLILPNRSHLLLFRYWHLPCCQNLPGLALYNKPGISKIDLAVATKSVADDFPSMFLFH
jgi:hypothetical protein